MVRDFRIASDAGLELVERARKLKSWNKVDLDWCEQAFVSMGTLKRFWRRSKKIQRENFDNICKAVDLDPDEICEPGVDINLSMEMEIAVLDEEWVGRESLITDLVTKLQKSHRIVLLLGITGIGKTSLAESLVIRLRGNWNELRENCENQARPKDFATIITGWLTTWGDRVSPDARNNPDRLLTQVVNKLCSGKYLLLIDSLEYLLATESNDIWGDFADRWWGSFFHSLLSAPTCNSRIILTSQDFPVQLARECARYPNLWHREVLTGLIATEQINLFTKLGFAKDLATEDSRLMLIGSIYDGHPLALRIIAGEIRASWQSNVRAYWRENGRYIEEVQTALKAAREEGKVEGSEDRWQLASYTVQLRRFVQTRINITFDRLKTQLSIAYELICIASIYRCEVPEFFWMDNLELEGYDLEQQQLAMTALRDRFLVEDAGFNEADERMVSQHNLIRSIAIARRLILAAEKDAHE
jgi:DNA-binding Xre family transcriptional regulator